MRVSLIRWRTNEGGFRLFHFHLGFHLGSYGSYLIGFLLGFHGK